jgi:hypothetical protein
MGAGANRRAKMMPIPFRDTFAMKNYRHKVLARKRITRNFVKA